MTQTSQNSVKSLQKRTQARLQAISSKQAKTTQGIEKILAELKSDATTISSHKPGFQPSVWVLLSLTVNAILIAAVIYLLVANLMMSLQG